MFIPVHTLIGCLQLCSPNSTTKVNDSYKRSSYKPEEASTLDKTEELLSKDVKPSFLPIYTIPYLKSCTRNKLHYLKQDNFSRSSWVSDVDIGDEQPLWATIKALNSIQNHKMLLQVTRSRNLVTIILMKPSRHTFILRRTCSTLIQNTNHL